MAMWFRISFMNLFRRRRNDARLLNFVLSNKNIIMKRVQWVSLVLQSNREPILKIPREANVNLFQFYRRTTSCC